jgi:hypothetical protein
VTKKRHPFLESLRGKSGGTANTEPSKPIAEMSVDELEAAIGDAERKLREARGEQLEALREQKAQGAGGRFLAPPRNRRRPWK